MKIQTYWAFYLKIEADAYWKTVIFHRNLAHIELYEAVAGHFPRLYIFMRVALPIYM